MQYAAFFDVDETVLRIKSMASFLKYYLEYKGYTASQIDSTVMPLLKLTKSGERREANSHYFKILRGEKIVDLYSQGQMWFDSLNISTVLNRIVVTELKNHQQQGGEIVFVSGAFDAILRPLAEYLAVDEVLCCQLDVENGMITGRLKVQMLGEDKASAMENYVGSYNIDLSSSYVTDKPMLQVVNNARLVNLDSIAELATKF